MRFTSSTRAESPPSKPIRRRKHGRRPIPLSPSISSQDPDDDSSPPYSAAGDDDEETDTATYSHSPSYPSNSLRPASSSSSFVPPPTANYVNVAPLPIFSGDPSECPIAHLARFDRACRANNATAVHTLVRIFPATLDGDAALWYDLSVQPLEDEMSWPEIRSAFLGAFTQPDFADRARAELVSIKQRDGEGVNAYHLRLQWILKKWPEHGFPDALLKGLFSDGLHEDYQDWILPQRPETLAEAVRLAMSWEQARNVRAARRANNESTSGGGEGAKCEFCGGGEHEESRCEVRMRMKELWLRRKGGAAVLSPAASIGRREGGEGEKLGEEGRVGSMRRGGVHFCQCTKHRCGSKKFERNNSAASVAAATEVEGDPTNGVD